MENITKISETLDREIDRLNLSGKPSGLYDPIRYILSLGGKRVRPLLTLAAGEMFSDSAFIAMPQALAIEVFHNFTLLHDDIMDEAPLRRNQETVHLKWNVNTGILSGDAMLIKAYQLLSDTPAAHLPNILRLFNETAIGVCEGQQYDMEFEERDNVTIPEYVEMIRLKTAVLLACALQTGSLVGGASQKDAEKMYEIGESLGIAFQIQDDILDAFGTEKVGKRKGGDIISNKKTFLLLSAKELATGNTAESLTTWINAKSFNEEEKVAAVLAIFETLDIKTIAQNEMIKYSDKAFQLLSELEIGEERKQNVLAILNLLLKREF